MYQKYVLLLFHFASAGKSRNEIQSSADITSKQNKYNVPAQHYYLLRSIDKDENKNDEFHNCI